MLRLLADDSATPGGLWAYLVVFALVAVGWAGVAALGGTVIAGAAVLASQGHLNIAGVLAASVLGTEAGGLAGYAIGIRWGRALVNHPGPWLDRRQRAVSAGEVLYARWGRLAVFFMPCLVSGMVKMKYSQFVVWNFLAGAVYVLSVGLAAYGAGKIYTGQASLDAVGTVVAGIAVGAAAFLVARRYYRRHRTRLAAASGHRGAAGPAPAADAAGPAPAADEEG